MEKFMHVRMNPRFERMHIDLELETADASDATRRCVRIARLLNALLFATNHLILYFTPDNPEGAIVEDGLYLESAGCGLAGTMDLDSTFVDVFYVLENLQAHDVPGAHDIVYDADTDSDTDIALKIFGVLEKYLRGASYRDDCIVVAAATSE